MKLFIQMAVLFAFLEIGEGIVMLAHLPIPGSIVGMVLLAFSLKFKIVRPQWIVDVADFLCANLGFFFIPAGVGVMNCMGIIKEQWMPIALATVLSTAVIILVTGQTHSLLRRSMHRRSVKKGGGDD